MASNLNSKFPFSLTNCLYTAKESAVFNNLSIFAGGNRWIIAFPKDIKMT